MVQYVDPEREPSAALAEQGSGTQGSGEQTSASEPAGPRGTDEFAVDLWDLEDDEPAASGGARERDYVGDDAASPGLVQRLHGYFGGDARRVREALEGYRGLYESVGSYVAQCLDSDGVPEWLLPYIDHEAIGRDWTLGGTIWTLPEELHDRQHERVPREGLHRGVHVFLR